MEGAEAVLGDLSMTVLPLLLLTVLLAVVLLTVLDDELTVLEEELTVLLAVVFVTGGIGGCHRQNQARSGSRPKGFHLNNRLHSKIMIAPAPPRIVVSNRLTLLKSSPIR